MMLSSSTHAVSQRVEGVRMGGVGGQGRAKMETKYLNKKMINKYIHACMHTHQKKKKTDWSRHGRVYIDK